MVTWRTANFEKKGVLLLKDKHFTVHMSKDQYDLLKNVAEKRGVSMSRIIRLSLRRYFVQKGYLKDD